MNLLNFKSGFIETQNLIMLTFTFTLEPIKYKNKNYVNIMSY